MQPDSQTVRFNDGKLSAIIAEELKVIKALAEYMEVSLGELIEIIVLASFEGTAKFSKGTLSKISDLKSIYELDYGIEAAHMMLFSTKRRTSARSV